MAQGISFPAPGCIVEYIEDNNIQTGMVLEETGGKLRIFLPNRREVKLGTNRILPWIGPLYPIASSKEEIVKIIEKHKKERQVKALNIDALEVWELAAEEIDQAPASWFAELFENDPGIDEIAAYGRILLECKTHFRFSGPDFLIFSREIVEKRLLEKEQRNQKEAFAGKGASFFALLWEIASKKRPMPENGDFTPFLPESAITEKLEKMLLEHMVNPETQKDEGLWQQITRSMPESPLLAIQLLQAWAKIPVHYNFWLDRAAYSQGDSWWESDREEVNRLIESADCDNPDCKLEKCQLPFLSIDGDSTRDIDDSFYLEKTASGWKIVLAFACPALNWPFGSHFDKTVAKRATSLYLPESVYNMLPVKLGEDVFSLCAQKQKPALCIEIELDEDCCITSTKPFLARISLLANLRYGPVQKLLDNEINQDENPALPYSKMLKSAFDLAKKLESKRILQGAVIMNRPEINIRVSGDGEAATVELEAEEDTRDSRLLVSELMILASAAIADWAAQNNIPLIHRTQKVTIPKEYAGIWSNPVDMAKIMRSMIPSILEITPGPHSALAVSRYAPITSPLRRYVDLVNEAQILAFLQTGKSGYDSLELTSLLNFISPYLESVSNVQKFRPRYWKLLYFRQKGDRCWWNAVITEENEHFVMVTLPEQGLFVKGKRQMFDERTAIGMEVMVRLGKINPLFNEIQILETMPAC